MIDYYYEKLSALAVGVTTTFSRAMLQTHYDMCLLDFTRFVLGDGPLVDTDGPLIDGTYSVFQGTVSAATPPEAVTTAEVGSGSGSIFTSVSN